MKHQLKGLQTQLNKARTELDLLKDESRETGRKITRTMKRIEELEAKISSAGTKGLVLSEHAILQYFTQVEGVDLDLVEDAIITPEIRACIEEFGSGKFPGDGYRVVVKDKVVVTVE